VRLRMMALCVDVQCVEVYCSVLRMMAVV